MINRQRCKYVTGSCLPIVLLLAATSQYYCNQLLIASARYTVSALAVTSCYKKALSVERKMQ